MNKINKKGISGIIVTSIIVLMIIIGAILCFPLIKPYLKPTYTIYKEECWNETGNYSGYKCEDETYYLGDSYEEYKEVVLSNGIRCYRNNETWIEQKCEKVEVVEKDFCMPLSEEILNKTYIDKEGVIWIYGGNCITKNLITQSWLDKNCLIPDCNGLPCENKYKCGDFEVEKF